jgi:hypothetical protein
LVLKLILNPEYFGELTSCAYTLPLSNFSLLSLYTTHSRYPDLPSWQGTPPPPATALVFRSRYSVVTCHLLFWRPFRRMLRCWRWLGGKLGDVNVAILISPTRELGVVGSQVVK